MIMSSNQWEVVTKSKKQRNLEKKVEAHTEKKRIADAGPKLEEILPSHMYKNIFANKDKTKEANNKESRSSPSKKQDGSNKTKSPKKNSKLNANNNQVQKDQALNNDSKKTPTAPKAKNLEAALQRISSDDLAAQWSHLKVTFPGSELLWLKGIASFLNSNLHFDCDPVFSGKSIHYPSNVVPKKLKTALIEILNTINITNLTYFYDTLLISMATELAKNQPIMGYKLLLQVIGQTWPEIPSSNLAKTAILRNSYQNRSNVGLSILWAIGQCGYYDINFGVKIWQNLMFPVLEMKNYSKYVSEYIYKILSSAVKDDVQLNCTQSEFFTTYNALTEKHGISNECQQLLTESSELILKKFIDSSSKLANLFLVLFREINDLQKNRVELEGCILCLMRGDDCFKTWKMNYKKHVKQSYLLLSKIHQQWEGSEMEIRDIAAFHSFLVEACQLNMELKETKRKDPYLNDLLSLFDNVQDKSMQQQKKKSIGKNSSGRCCKWVLGSIFIVSLIFGIVIYDTNANGKGVFEKSAIGKALKNAGLLPYVEKAWFATVPVVARGFKWFENNVPGYLKPFTQLMSDLFKMGRNASLNIGENVKQLAVKKWPVVTGFLDQYIPGLSKNIEGAFAWVHVTFDNIRANSLNFLKTQVFVGKFSPENLGKALNETQFAAAQYYSWFHNKVEAYAKLK